MKAEKTGWVLLFTGLMLVMCGFILGEALARAFRCSQGTAAVQKACAQVKPAWRGGETLSAGMMKKIQKEFGEQPVTYTVKSLLRQQIKDCSGKGVDADIQGVDLTWSMFHHFTYLSGGFFPATRNADVMRTAVISEDFSYKLFRTHLTTGMELEIYGETFRIAGVFKTKEDILYDLVQPGLPDVLIPAETMLALDEKAYIDAVEVWTDSSLTFGSSTDRLLAALIRAGADMNRLTVTDFVNAEKSIAQRPWLLILTAGLITALSCLRCLFRWATGLFQEIRAAYAGLSFGALRSSLLHRGLSLILPVMILVVLILLWVQNDFSFYIPAEYLPGEKLEGRKYAELLLEALRQFFSGINEEASVNVKLLQAAGLLSGALFRTALFAGFILCRAGMAMINSRSFHRMLGKAGSLMVISILVACVFTVAWGLPLKVHTEGIMILWFFIATGLIQNPPPLQEHHPYSALEMGAIPH